tara:strand:+ start:424 stop:705 length:282 start_codon:yes stop_codon:yes gene_type:complete
VIEFNIDRVQKELDGKYNLSHLIINRVKRLRAGVESKVEKKMREKDIVLAIREIESGDLVYERDEETTRQMEVDLTDTVIDEDNSAVLLGTEE